MFLEYSHFSYKEKALDIKDEIMSLTALRNRSMRILTRVRTPKGRKEVCLAIERINNRLEVLNDIVEGLEWVSDNSGEVQLAGEALTPFLKEV